jgi:DNA-binding GntR family transcriptional regulator
MQFKKETYSSKAAEYIRSLIRSGDLLPGQPVREALISDQLNISRAPIREALLILAQEGLICSEPQKGKYVRSMSAQEIYDSYAVAGILEGAGVVQSIAHWGDREEAAFEDVVYRLDQQVNYAVSLDTLAEIDELFHATLLSACLNKHLIHLAHSSSSSLAKFLYYHYWRTMFTPQEFRERHHLIASAVRSRDMVRIEHSLRQHYEEVGIRLCELVHENQLI